jgi:hypothetical protein
MAKSSVLARFAEKPCNNSSRLNSGSPDAMITITPFPSRDQLIE